MAGHGVAVFYSRLVGAPDPLEDLRLRAPVADRVAADDTAQVVAFAKRAALARREEHPALHIRQVRLHEQRLSLAHAAPRELVKGAVNERLDFARGALVLPGAQADANAVAGKHLLHLVRWQEHVTTVVEANEAEAGAGTAHDAFGALLLGFHLVLEAAQLGEGVLI